MTALNTNDSFENNAVCFVKITRENQGVKRKGPQAALFHFKLFFLFSYYNFLFGYSKLILTGDHVKSFSKTCYVG